MNLTVRVVALVVAGALALSCAQSNEIREETMRSASSPETTPREPFEQAVGHFNKTRSMYHVRALAKRIGVRVRAGRGERRGARYAARRLRSLGYDVNVRTFDVSEGTSRNVVASWPGAIRYPVVIGGHMDTVPGSPGANDNASGVAVILELARIVADARPARYVKFVLFGAEEYGSDDTHHVGSEVFVDRLGRRGRRKLDGMVSVDMVADGRPLIVGTAGIGPEVVARTLFRTIRRTSVDVTYRTTCDCSDNGPFEHAGIPAAFAWSGDEPDYHSSSDTVPNMSPADLLRTGRAMRAFVMKLDFKLLERFRRA